eukprot:874306-Rhodomonas_salina.3
MSGNFGTRREAVLPRGGSLVAVSESTLLQHETRTEENKREKKTTLCEEIVFSCLFFSFVSGAVLGVLKDRVAAESRLMRAFTACAHVTLPRVHVTHPTLHAIRPK